MREKSEKISTEAYKGVRDFYPEDMAIQSYIFDVWKKTVESYGYQEYGASVLEPANLYKAKSGEEIVNEQTYTFIDRGEREVTLRPEMTPTVARMVAARKRELVFPLRWYSIPNLFRYEAPQRGRVREHWQLNVDMFGVESIEADTEVISLAYKIMKAFSAKDGDFTIRINSRQALQKEIEALLDDAASYPKAVRLIDKKEKISAEDFQKEWTKISSKPFNIDTIATPEKIADLQGKLALLGIKNVVFYPFLMRGFDYYTDIVFEIFDTSPENRRSLFGGGRYDKLTTLFSDDNVPAVGFCMGDVTIRDFLETHGLLHEKKASADYCVCVVSESGAAFAMKIADELREKNSRVAIDFSYKKIGDQIKNADRRGIPEVIVIGEDEVATGTYKIKNLKTGKEQIIK
ncbi:MAG: histidine--tRNA ligase [bacterium]